MDAQTEPGLEKLAAWINKEYAEIRHCCRACSDEYFNAERRQAVAYFRAQGMRPQLRNGEERKEA